MSLAFRAGGFVAQAGDCGLLLDSSFEAVAVATAGRVLDGCWPGTAACKANQSMGAQGAEYTKHTKWCSESLIQEPGPMQAASRGKIRRATRGWAGPHAVSWGGGADGQEQGIGEARAGRGAEQEEVGGETAGQSSSIALTLGGR